MTPLWVTWSAAITLFSLKKSKHCLRSRVCGGSGRRFTQMGINTACISARHCSPSPHAMLRCAVLHGLTRQPSHPPCVLVVKPAVGVVDAALHCTSGGRGQGQERRGTSAGFAVLPLALVRLPAPSPSCASASFGSASARTDAMPSGRRPPVCPPTHPPIRTLTHPLPLSPAAARKSRAGRPACAQSGPG